MNWSRLALLSAGLGSQPCLRTAVAAVRSFTATWMPEARTHRPCLFSAAPLLSAGFSFRRVTVRFCFKSHLVPSCNLLSPVQGALWRSWFTRPVPVLADLGAWCRSEARLSEPCPSAADSPRALLCMLTHSQRRALWGTVPEILLRAPLPDKFATAVRTAPLLALWFARWVCESRSAVPWAGVLLEFCSRTISFVSRSLPRPAKFA